MRKTLTAVLLSAGLAGCSFLSDPNSGYNGDTPKIKTEIVYITSPDPLFYMARYKIDEEAERVMSQVILLQMSINSEDKNKITSGQLLSLYRLAANGNDYITLEEAMILYKTKEDELLSKYPKPTTSIIPYPLSPSEPPQKPLN